MQRIIQNKILPEDWLHQVETFNTNTLPKTQKIIADRLIKEILEEKK